jgi:hypothetical protein
MSSGTNLQTYNTQFYDEITPLSVAAAAVIVPLLAEWLAPTSVIDVGCGAGVWLQEFQRHGVDDVLGLDGDWVPPEQLRIDPSCFRPVDLERPPDLGRRFSLAMSVEVAEHLRPDAAERFVSLLTDAAPVVMFSGALPLQGGHGHRNEQWPAYWARLFAQRGYAAFDIVRPRVWNDPAVPYWYSQNIAVYAVDDRLEHVRPRFPLDSEGRPLPLVHPTLAGKLVRRVNVATLRALARDVPELSQRLARRQMGRLRARRGA